jgi:hypothetical protein
MAGMEERDEGRHSNDKDMITMMMLPLPLLPPDNLKKVIINSIGRTRWAIEGWENAMAIATATAMATATATAMAMAMATQQSTIEGVEVMAAVAATAAAAAAAAARQQDGGGGSSGSLQAARRQQKQLGGGT